MPAVVLDRGGLGPLGVGPDGIGPHAAPHFTVDVGTGQDPLRDRVFGGPLNGAPLLALGRASFSCELQVSRTRRSPGGALLRQHATPYTPKPGHLTADRNNAGALPSTRVRFAIRTGPLPVTFARGCAEPGPLIVEHAHAFGPLTTDRIRRHPDGREFPAPPPTARQRRDFRSNTASITTAGGDHDSIDPRSGAPVRITGSRSWRTPFAAVVRGIR